MTRSSATSGRDSGESAEGLPDRVNDAGHSSVASDGFPNDGFPNSGIPHSGIPHSGIPHSGIPHSGSNVTFHVNPFASRFIRPGAVAFHVRHLQCGVDDAESLASEIVSILRRSSCGAIVGPHGSGKSTLIASLHPFLATEFGRVRELVLRDPTQIETIDHRVAVGLADSGGDQDTNRRETLRYLNPLQKTWRQWRGLRRDRRLVKRGISALRPGDLLLLEGAEQLSGRDITRLAARARTRGWCLILTAHDMLPGIPLLHQTGIEVDLIRTLTRQLLRDSPDEVVQAVQLELAGRDLDRVTNLRELWFDLYDVVQPLIQRASGSSPPRPPHARPIASRPRSDQATHR